jgi:hypothetical protein
MRNWLAALILIAVAGCSNKLGGDVTVDGQKLEVSSCRSGAVYGFRGVEVTGKSGLRLRVASTQTGEANVVVMQPGAAVGTDLGPCGSFEISDQHSTINDVKNVAGKAKLDCVADGVTVKGSLTFENCH